MTDRLIVRRGYIKYGVIVHLNLEKNNQTLSND
jgi:hypothetical protein